MQALNFEEVLKTILDRDQRYHREAYLFLKGALDFSQKLASKVNKNEVRHVTGQELLEGVRQYGLAQYGPMTETLLNEWGVTRCEDFGEMVFNMVDSGLLSKTETDSREDFKGGYQFSDAFRTPFRPLKAKAPPVPEVR